jgi:multidrug transporter EmrE-like cation transporter
VTELSSTTTWSLFLIFSIAGDVAATTYLKLAGDRIDGLSFFWAAVIGVIAFAPSIILFGYALQAGPSYIATIGIWAVGVFAVNAALGFLAFGDVFSFRAALGIVLACVTIVLLKPA